MSYPENKENPTITVLKSLELIHIFGYLDDADVLRCRLVCSHWHSLINEEQQLIDRFSFDLTLDSGTAVCVLVPPFSFILKSSIKCKHLTILDNFMDPGNGIAAVEANSEKISTLSSILARIGAFQTVTELTVIARDTDTRTNALLFELIKKMTNMKVLRFTMTAFVHVLRSPNQQKFTSLEHVQILHKNCFKLVVADFTYLLNIFPNINRIDVKPSEAMLLKRNIFVAFASLFKSVEYLDQNALRDLTGINNMSLTHISYDDCKNGNNSVESLKRFLATNREIATMSLRFSDYESIQLFFYKEFVQITELCIYESLQNGIEENRRGLILDSILKYTPNLERLMVKFEAAMAHFFTHQKVEMRHLVHLTLKRLKINCQKCFETMLKSLVHLKSLKLTSNNSAVTLVHMSAIAKHLVKLETLELIYGDIVNEENYFQSWPSMPNLKQLIANRVGQINERCIKNLSKNCPMLEVLKLYSLRSVRMDVLLKLTLCYFPDIEVITFHCDRGGELIQIDELHYLDDKVGWKLKELDISADIQSDVILQLFIQNSFLEKICCKYGSVVVTRRIFFEVGVLREYDLKSVEQPLQNRKRLYAEEDEA